MKMIFPVLIFFTTTLTFGQDKCLFPKNKLTEFFEKYKVIHSDIAQKISACSEGKVLSPDNEKNIFVEYQQLKNYYFSFIPRIFQKHNNCFSIKHDFSHISNISFHFLEKSIFSLMQFCHNELTSDKKIKKFILNHCKECNWINHVQ